MEVAHGIGCLSWWTVSAMRLVWLGGAWYVAVFTTGRLDTDALLRQDGFISWRPLKCSSITPDGRWRQEEHAGQGDDEKTH